MARALRGRDLREFHVFLASPGDVPRERDLVRSYFDSFNRTTALTWGVRFQVIDWENHSTIGLGRPQELITSQTLERFRDSLALVIVIMAQRFGTPSGVAESGTEEEIRWARASHAESGFPEVKFFFRETGQFVAPDDEGEILKALEQWQKVKALRRELKDRHSAFVRSYPGPDDFEPVLRLDLDNWFHSTSGRWSDGQEHVDPAAPGNDPPPGYFTELVRSYQWLDISGIDAERAFKLPLDKVYVRLRVIAGDDAEAGDAATFTIQTALERYRRLVIVGDPGSGKSTFLRFIALTLAQSCLADDAGQVQERLSLSAPLPAPIFLSCWDLAEYLHRVGRADRDAVVDFAAERLRSTGWALEPADLARILDDGECILLVDGLDEVPTDDARRIVARLIEELVERYPDNRYVVTSRIRAYTGAAILGERFARCDIQPFNVEERTAFLQNWVRQLFDLRGEAGEPEIAAEVAALSEAIETSSIRSLAVNPLLLTVIAIVHWNRRRLPEGRVELYDECIDVLLGQRKQAEQQQISRDTKAFDEEFDDARLDQRAKVRKRFAEIAYNILIRSNEEIDHAAVVRLLRPHFESDDDLADDRATRFLDRQELRSGLLVRRGASSYTFVHLTFLEYLAAWHLAQRDLEPTLADLLGHLREPKWFETLQLLGGLLANRSDEYLDRYISWMLDHVGRSISDQAPVIALAANIVRDTQSVTTLTSSTQAQYEARLRDTFDAFALDSKVPQNTQMDLLEALAKVGRSVKSHLMSATNSRLLAVRRRALEILVPYLSDDDLFSLTNVLMDRSKEPIKTYLEALLARDRVRTGRILLDLGRYPAKLLEALAESSPPKLPAGNLDSWPRLVAASTSTSDEDAFRLLVAWGDDRDERWRLTENLARAGSNAALTTLLQVRGQMPETWRLLDQLDDPAISNLVSAARGGRSRYDPIGLAVYLERSWSERAETVTLLRRMASAGSVDAVSALIRGWADHDETWRLAAARRDEDLHKLASLEDWIWLSARPEARSLMGRMALNGDIYWVGVLVRTAERKEEAWEVLAALSDEAFVNFVRYYEEVDDLALKLERFSPVWPQAMTLVARLASAGVAMALFLLHHHSADPAEVAPAVDGMNRDAVENFDRTVQSTQRLFPAPDEDLLHQLMMKGSGFAFGVLMTSVPERIWALLAALTDAEVASLVTTNPPTGGMIERWVALWPAQPRAKWLLRRLAAAGSAQALLAFVRAGLVDGSLRSAIRNMDDAAVGRLARDFWWTNPTELLEADPAVADLVWRAARAGSTAAFSAIVGSSGDIRTGPDEDRMWDLVRSVADEGRLDHRVVPPNRNWFAELAAHQPDRPETWETIEGAARHGVDRALETLLESGQRHDQTRQIVADLATGGSIPALTALLRVWGEREETKQLIASLSDSVVRDLADDCLGTIVWWGVRHPEAWDLITRMAESGSEMAVRALNARPGRRDETRMKLERLAEHHNSAMAVRLLVEQWAGRPETWELLRTSAERGSVAALIAVTEAKGDVQETRDLLAHLLLDGPGDNIGVPTAARTAAAWLLWAIETSPSTGARDIKVLIPDGSGRRPARGPLFLDADSPM